MKRFWLLVLAVSVGLNGGLLYRILSQENARPDRDHVARPPPPEPDLESVLENHLRRMTASLGLDEQQRAAIETVHEKRLPGILAERRILDDLRREIANHYARPEIDSEEFLSLVRRLGEAQSRLDAHVTEAMLGEAAVLTFEQRKKYAREMPWGPPKPRPERGRDD